MLIFSINPGATSTKCALYENETMIFTEEVRYTHEELKKYPKLIDQMDMRYASLMDALHKHKIDESDIDVVVARGGILPPVGAGAIVIDDNLVSYLLYESDVEHPANLAAAMAKRIVDQNGKGIAYVYDPISVDQLDDISRVSGLKGIERKSVGHMLNSRAVAIKYAKDKGVNYHDTNLIVVHAGTGITVTAHKKGRMVDLVGDDEGAFSPERSGGIPLRAFMNLCYNNDRETVVHLMRHVGGLMSYFNTNDVRDVEALIDAGNKEAALVLEAMAYQIAKSIGQLSPVFAGNLDAIVISGGFSRSQRVMKWIEERVSFLADVIVYPGEYELEALSLGGYRAYLGEEEVQTFKK